MAPALNVRMLHVGPTTRAPAMPDLPSTAGQNADVTTWGPDGACGRDRVTHGEVVRAIQEYDRLGPHSFFSEHGFAPTTTYELVGRNALIRQAILGTAYEFATGQRLASGDFEGGKTGAVAVLGKLGFTVQEKGDQG